MVGAMRVLVGYASRFGSTREIAVRIGAGIRSNGSDVDVRSAD
jgi:menaquinone-dependent protoporphyrinogen IX oxidase